MRKAVSIVGGALSALQGNLHDVDATAKMKALAELATHDADYTVTLTAPLNVNANNMYAGHGSHRSHSSHSSHSSHYSSSGGSYRYTAPDPEPAAPPPPPPSYTPTPRYTPPRGGSYTPTLQPSSTPRPTTDQLQLMIMRVQAALYSKGYDPGAIDGTLGDATKSALRKFQKDHGLKESGSMSTETLNALGIALR